MARLDILNFIPIRPTVCVEILAVSDLNSIYFRKMAQAEPQEKKQPKSFEALTPELSSWILEYAQSMGFVRTTPVQAMAIPLLMGNKDLVVEVGLIFPVSNRAHF
jgi:hypothetical protein